MPRLFQQQPEIPLLLYYWRYFDRNDLQRCFPVYFRSETTARDYLQRWRAAGYIKSARPGYQHQQHLHSLTPAAIVFLSAHYGYDFNPTADEVVSPVFVEHERGISHFQSDIYTAVKDRPDLSVPVWLRRFGVDRDSTLLYHDEVGERILRPDLAFLLVRKLPDGSVRPQLNFVELDRGTEDMTVIGRKLRKYQLWYNDTGRETLRRWYAPYSVVQTSFRLLVVTQHRQPAGNHGRQLIRWYTQALLQTPQLPLLISTLNDVEAYRRGGTHHTWLPLFWFKRSWLSDVLACQQMSQAYDYVAEKLSSFESRYAVLPPPA